MDTHTPGIRLVHPDLSSNHLTIDAFVDEINSGLTTDGLKSFKTSPTAPVAKHDTIYDQTAANLQFYSDLLSSSGGKLALHESYAYVLKTTWRQGHRRLIETQTHTPPLPITQQSQQHEMNLLSQKTSSKMLGVHKEPDGNSTEQAKVLRTKTGKWRKALKNKALYQFEALLAYKHALMPAIQYPLGASLLKEQQCEHIQSPELTTVLQKCGIVSKISRDIVHGPSRYGGLNFTKIYTEAGCQKIRLILGHIRKGDKTGDIIRIELGCAQQEIVLSKFILNEPYSHYEPICTTSWIQYLWEFFESADGKIDYPTMWLPTLPFIHDVNLTEFVRSQKPESRIFYMFNIFRLHKRVYFLGDLLDPTGTRLRPHALELHQRQYNENKFPLTSLPPRDTNFEEVWQMYIRPALQLTQLGNALGPIQTRCSYELCLTQEYATMIRFQNGDPISTNQRLDEDTYDINPAPATNPIVPGHVALVSINTSQSTVNIRSSDPVKSFLSSPQPQISTSAPEFATTPSVKRIFFF